MLSESNRWRTPAGAWLLAVLLAGCASATTAPANSAGPSEVGRAASSSNPTGVASPRADSGNPSISGSPAAAATARAEFDGIVTVGGTSQYVHCAGTGSPTVVVVPGLDSSMADWSEVLPALAKQTRTCSYDRPGIGQSPPRSSDRSVDAGLHAKELSAALASAGEMGPWLIVGHSYGGLVARALAKDLRPDLAGVVLAEGVTPFDDTNGSDWPEGGTVVDLTRSYEATGDGPQLGALPLVVMTASHPERDHLGGPTYGQSDEVTAAWLRGQAAAATLSSNVISVVAESGHVLQQDDPAAVIKAVTTVITAARTGRPVTCNDDWAAVNAVCTTPTG